VANEQLVNATADLDENRVHSLVQEGLSAGVNPSDLLDDCRAGLGIVGRRFESGDYFLSDLMMAGEIFRSAAAVLGAQGGSSGPTKGVVIVGTVEGDIHDIGKDLVVTMLRAANYEVEDLGVDVPPATFVQKVRELHAPVVGMSGLITISFDSMKQVVTELEAEGLRDQVKVMIGGGPVTERVRRYVGADGFGEDAQAAVSFADQWIRN
jgi:methanogenic corrinoid protein MtbC1